MMVLCLVWWCFDTQCSAKCGHHTHTVSKFLNLHKHLPCLQSPPFFVWRGRNFLQRTLFHAFISKIETSNLQRLCTGRYPKKDCSTNFCAGYNLLCRHLICQKVLALDASDKWNSLCILIHSFQLVPRRPINISALCVVRWSNRVGSFIHFYIHISSMLQFAVGFVITPSCRGGRSKPKMGCRPSQKQNNAKKQVPSP